MKALTIFVLFTALAFGAMAQKPAGDNTRVVFDSPEPTVKVHTTGANVNTADRVSFDSPEVTVKTTPTANPAAAGAKRVEFTSPAPTSISTTGKKEDE